MNMGERILFWFVMLLALAASIWLAVLDSQVSWLTERPVGVTEPLWEWNQV